MASANPRDVLMLDEDIEKPLTVEEMQELQAEFAKEAFTFLARHADLSIDDPEDFFTRQTDPDNGVVFSTDVGKAILTIAYLLRIEFRKKFLKISCRMSDPAMFEVYVTSYPVRHSNMYFYHFLEWVAFVFETTVLCYNKGYNYFRRGEACIANYKDLEYFVSRGGWYYLLEHSKGIANIFDEMDIIISPEAPQDEILPFLVSVECLMIQERSSGYKLRETPKIKRMKEIRSQLLKKFAVIDTSDPETLTPGFKVISRKFPSTSTPRDSAKSPDEPFYESSSDFDESELNYLISQVEKTGISNTSGSESSRNPSPCYEDYSKAIFLLRERLLNKRKEALKDPNSKYKRHLQTISPSDETQTLSRYIDQIIDENIESENYLKIEGGVYAICPPGCTIYDEDVQFRLMRDSSDEEDDCFTELCCDTILKLRSRHQDHSRSEFGVKQESKCAAAIPSEQLDRDSESKESALTEKKSVPTKCTGAIPKATKTDSMKGQLAEDRSGDLPDLGVKDDEPEKKPISSGNWKKKKKSKK